MIRFALACARGHRFEGWFSTSGGFDAQRDDGRLACPVCGSAEVDKTLMAPAVVSSPRKEAVMVAAPATPTIPDNAEAIAALRRFRRKLTENAEYVGPRFAEEARRIHYDESEKRGIYGEATADEVKALAEEDIGFHPLPTLPEDHN